jgi:hypothetical protein
MEKVQKHSNSVCYAPSSEPFRVYLEFLCVASSIYSYNCYGVLTTYLRCTYEELHVAVACVRVGNCDASAMSAALLLLYTRVTCFAWPTFMSFHFTVWSLTPSFIVYHNYKHIHCFRFGRLIQCLLGSPFVVKWTGA